MLGFKFINKCAGMSSMMRYNYTIRQLSDINLGTTKEQQIKSRRRYALLGGFMMMFFGSHAILLWRRRSEYRALNKEVPPITLAEFEREYLLTGKVKTLVVHPNFGVVDGYTEEKDLTTQKIGRSMLQSKTFFGQKFFNKPQVRFVFDKKPEALEQLILDAQKTLENPPEIHFEVNSFPSYRELAFIVGSTLFGITCAGVMTA